MFLSNPKANKFELVVVFILVVIVAIIFVMEVYGLEVLTKISGPYQVPKLRNWISKNIQEIVNGRT